MKTFLARTSILLTLAFLFLAGYKTAEYFMPDVTEEEYSVYAVVIPNIRWSKEEPALIHSQTCPDAYLEKLISYIKNDMPTLQDETLSDFIDRDKISGSLQKARFDFDYTFFNMNDFLETTYKRKNIFTSFSWELFRDKFEEGSIICVSRVGFNTDYTQAFLYASSVDAGLAGRGYYILLKYIDNAWKIEAISLAWMS